MLHRRPRIAILFLGGSTLSGRGAAALAVERDRDISNWLEQIPELRIIAELETHFIGRGDPAPVGRAEWLQLVRAIKRRYDDVDGFLVTHSLETLPYTASVLTFLAQRLGKPVVFAGSSHTRSVSVGESRANIVNAAQVAISDLAEVCVVFGSRIYRGSRTVLLPSGGSVSLATPDQSSLGKIDFGFRFDARRARRSAQKPRLTEKLETHVALLPWHPGVDRSLFHQALRAGLRGVILTTSETTFIPDDFQRELHEAQRHGSAIFIAGAGERAAAIGFPSVDQMTQTAALMKLMWALGQTRDRKRVEKLMASDIAGEVLGS